jgi:diguanylate cyclase (GGDEF)-like protein/PAS domain S-box-containing protein
MLRLELAVPLVFILAAVFYALLGLYAWRRRPAVAVAPFAWTMFSLAVWAFAYGLEVFLPTLPAKLAAVNLEYIGIASAPVFLFYYALHYTGRNHLLTPRLQALIWLIPILTALLVWTNPIHQWMWDAESIIPMGRQGLLQVHFAAAFWVSITFFYAMFITSGSMLLMDFVQRLGAYRLHISFVILAMLFSFSGSLLFLAGFSPIANLDLTSLFLLPSSVGLAWVTLHQRLAEVLTLEYVTVLKNMPDSVIVLNGERRILYLNPKAERLLGKTEDEAIGQPFEKAAGSFVAALQPCLDEKQPRAEIQARAGGEAKTYEVSISSTAAERGLGETVISLHDITGHKEKESELSRRDSIMSAISAAAEQFLKSFDWKGNIPGVLKSLGLAADVSRVYVVVNRKDADGDFLSSLSYEWAAPGIEPQIQNPGLKDVPLVKTGFSRWVDGLAEGHSIHGLVKDLPAQEAEFIAPLGSLSIAIVPIFAEYRWWGFLMFDECRRERQWSALELDAFHAAASIFGAAEARDRTSQKLMNRQLSISMLNFIVTASLQAETLSEMAEITTNRLANLIGANGCFMTLWEDENQRAIPLAAYGLVGEQPYSEIHFEPGRRTFTQSALELGQTLVVEDVDDTPYANHSVVEKFPSKSILALPLIVRSRKLGTVLIAFNERHHFTEEEIEISEQAAALIALATEKFQAVEEARRRADTSETLRKAGKAVSENLEMGQAITHILDQLKQVAPYDSASVQLLEGMELVIVGGRGWDNDADVLGMRFPIPGDNPNSVVIETGKPYRLPDAGKVYEQFNEPPHNHIRSWLGVPLIAQEKVIGLLAIDSAEPDDFTEEEIQTALEFANQVASALENARLFRESQTQAITDALTGVYNRRGILQLGEFEFKRARRLRRPFSVMMFDIDHFKQVNDRHGHAAGDEALQQFARRCLNASRAADLIGRYGGEEFIILLPETNLEAARIIGERLRHAIMDAPFLVRADEIKITTSIGVAEAAKHENLAAAIQRADTALYKAKHAGRNRVIVDEAPHTAAQV